MQLTTKQIPLPIPQMPQQYAPFVKPLTYEFRVAEHYTEDGKIAKVVLQVQTYEHDEYGVSIVKQYWQDVPRIKIDVKGSIIPPV